ncbi:MAG: packaged DNA stabilization gp4 family protein [Pseudomonadota bacterium]
MGTVKDVVKCAFSRLGYRGDIHDPTVLDGGALVAGEIVRQAFRRIGLASAASAVSSAEPHTITTRKIVYDALARLGVYDEVETVDATDAARALSSLNDMMHAWRADGVLAGYSSVALTDAFPLPQRHHEAVIAMLALRITDDFAPEAATPILADEAKNGWELIRSEYHVSTGLRILDNLVLGWLSEGVDFNQTEIVQETDTIPIGRRYEQAVVAMLAKALVEAFATPGSMDARNAAFSSLFAEANRGWMSLQFSARLPLAVDTLNRILQRFEVQGLAYTYAAVTATDNAPVLARLEPSLCALLADELADEIPNEANATRLHMDAVEARGQFASAYWEVPDSCSDLPTPTS